MENLKTTPLNACHREMGAKMVPFGGFDMPVQYEGIKSEHLAVRKACGLFDVSHMGEMRIEGPDAIKEVNRLFTNRFEDMVIGRCRYTLMLNEEGGVLDDMLIYKLGEESYWVIANASNREKDAQWLRSHLEGDVTFRDESDDYGLLALQGPQAEAILNTLAMGLPKKYYTFTDGVDIQGVKTLVSRTGYTGEDGFEIYIPAQETQKVWNALLEAGKEYGLVPAGLGARDTLRIEAAMPLYGHEITEDIDPITAGLTFAVKLDKDDFIGKEAVERLGAKTRTRVGLKVTGRGIVREGAEIYLPGEDKAVGFVTSGTHLPYLDGAYAMAYVDLEHKEIGTALEADVRGKRVAVEVVALPFYKRN